MSNLGISPIEPPRVSVEAPATPDTILLAAFNELRNELTSTLMYVLGSREDASDVAQETFIKCWKVRETIHEIQNIRAWIFRIGLNAAKDLQRSAWNRRSRPFLGDEPMIVDQHTPPMELLEERESLQRLQVAIMELRDEEKEVFLLRQNGELTYEQIAEIRHAPVGTVKTQMRSALQKLRKILDS